MSEQIRTYHSGRCEGCGALLPADDWSRRWCDLCGEERFDGTPYNWDVFWGDVARMHRIYGVIEREREDA